MRVTIMLADAAQEANGKLFILGGGWSVTGPAVPAHAVAVKIDVPWDQANEPHEWSLQLLTEDGHPAVIGQNEERIMVQGRFEVGRPPGLRPGTPIDVPLAVNVSPLPLQPGGRYVWELTIDGRTEPDWRREFQVREQG